MTVNLDELEKLAKAATPGPWAKSRSNNGISPIPDDPHGAVCFVHGMPGVRAFGNANYIEAANPATILAMIAELRAAREVIGEIPKGTGAFFDLKAILKKRKAYDAAIGGEGEK